MGRTPTWQEKYAEDHEAQLRDGQAGWHVLSDAYRKPHLFDGISLEWDYYSIHDDNGQFTGIIGYLVADPEGKLGGRDEWWAPHLMPSGGNIAINGKLKDNSGDHSIKVNYVNFGLDVDASADERRWYAENDEGSYGNLEPCGEGMCLSGRTPDFEWDLFITQAWGPGDNPDYYSLTDQTWEVATDIDLEILNQEHWTVNPLWTTTYVEGTITDRKKNEIYNINGHGYRENSFGRWIFIAGGWDFWFHSDMINKVQVGFQTYHYNTEDLDFLDLGFIDNGTPVNIRFFAADDELGWEHYEWAWNTESRQAVPKDVFVVGKNDDYTVELYATIARDEDGVEVLDYTPMLSNVTMVTRLYVIQCLYPMYSGTIYRNNPDGSTDYNDIVTDFGGIGGGEFSTAKSIFRNLDPDVFEAWLGDTYSHDFPE